MSELKLYTNPRSRGQIASWLMEESGLEFESTIVEFGGDFHLGDYAKINPMRKLPSLVHGDKLVTECAAICAYIADVFPESGLKPKEGLHDYYRWLFFAAGPVEAAVTNKAMGFEVPKEKEGMMGYGNFERTIETLRQGLKGKKFIAGDQFTAADVYVGSQVGWGLQFGTLPKNEEFEQYWDGLQNREAYQRSLATS